MTTVLPSEPMLSLLLLLRLGCEAARCHRRARGADTAMPAACVCPLRRAFPAARSAVVPVKFVSLSYPFTVAACQVSCDDSVARMTIDFLSLYSRSYLRLVSRRGFILTVNIKRRRHQCHYVPEVDDDHDAICVDLQRSYLPRATKWAVAGNVLQSVTASVCLSAFCTHGFYASSCLSANFKTLQFFWNR